MGYFSRVNCKGNRPGSDCQTYRGSSPSGAYNPNVIDSTGFCRSCRSSQGIADGSPIAVAVRVRRSR